MDDKTLVIERVFNAPRSRVWRAWTEAEQIKKWWGPKGFTAPAIEIDFREGGSYLYCMHGAPAPGMDAIDAWSGGEFKEIVPEEKIVVTDWFADKDGNKLKPTDFGLPAAFPEEAEIVVMFEEVESGKTRLTITYPMPDTAEGRQAMIDSQMEAGWNQSLDKFAASLE